MDTKTKIYLSTLISLTSQKTYLVGGSVRDLLLGIPDIKDIDIVMPSGSECAARIFAEKTGGSFFFLDEERKITRVVMHDDNREIQFDFTNFEGPDLKADLGRRDFTINAMALDLRDYVSSGSVREVVDLFGGRADLEKGLIRATKPGVLEEDPLRMLRGLRFASLLKFKLEGDTREQIRSRADLITKPAPERIRDEFFQILSRQGAADCLLLMDDLGLLSRLLPELNALTGFSPGKYHAFDVRTHSLKAVEHVDGVIDDLPRISPDYAHLVIAHLDEHLEHLVPRSAALRFACLLHDIAKPETLTRDEEGHIHFYGHDNLGALKAKDICARFRLARGTQSVVASVIKQHMRLFNLSTPGGPSKNAMYRYCRDMGEALPESLLLSQADARATIEIMPRDRFLDTERPMAIVLEYFYEKFLKTEAAPLVSGQDLIARGLKPGPRFKEILEDIRERQAAGTLKDRTEALEFIDRLRSSL